MVFGLAWLGCLFVGLLAHRINGSPAAKAASTIPITIDAKNAAIEISEPQARQLKPGLRCICF